MMKTTQVMMGRRGAETYEKDYRHKVVQKKEKTAMLDVLCIALK